MKYNKSEIMKRAWDLYKVEGYTSFASALTQAWREAKANLGTVRADELTVGDTIAIEYGDYSNMVICTIISISDELFLGRFVSIKAVATNGLTISFCPEPSARIRKVEVEAIEMKAAA